MLMRRFWSRMFSSSSSRPPGLGSRSVGDLVSNMSEEGSGPVEGPDTSLHPLIKAENLPAGLMPSKPPSLIPIPGREGGQSSAEKQQVQAAMAMAAFYSQNPLWQAALARERLQQQHPAAATAQQLAAAAALSQLPGRPPGLGLGGLGLAGLLNTAVTSSSGLQALPALPGLTGLETNRTDLFRDYLSKLAQSSLTSATSVPQYLSGVTSLSTSQLASPADNIKTENPLPASLRPGPALPASNNSRRRSSSPASASFSSYFPLVRGTAGAGGGQGGGQEVKTTSVTRSPPGTNGRRNGNSNGREKVFTCNVCNRSFGYKHVLQNHERTHTGEKPFECKECHKRFTRDHHLKTHMRLHTGEKPYSCPHCDRQFVQVANLRRHVRVHTGERPYKCELCPSDFSDSNQLKAHMLIHKTKQAAAPTFSSLKEELLFRHTMAAGFPLPQYPPAPALLSTVSPPDLDARSHASLSPDSKETTGSADSPGQAENLSDSNSEKRRSRKQKPRKMIFGEQEREENTETEEEGGSSRDRSPRDRHQSASSSYRDDGLPMQQEPEDLTVRSKATAKDEGYLSFRAGATMSDFGLKRDSEPEEAAYRTGKPARNRSEGSEGSLTASDPLSAHSTPNEKFRSDDLDEDKDDDDRGVSPPMSHPSMYNQLFGAPAAIQLGLSGAAVPLNPDYIEKESEMMAMVAQKEISQQ